MRAIDDVRYPRRSLDTSVCSAGIGPAQGPWVEWRRRPPLPCSSKSTSSRTKPSTPSRRLHSFVGRISCPPGWFSVETESCRSRGAPHPKSPGAPSETRFAHRRVPQRGERSLRQGRRRRPRSGSEPAERAESLYAGEHVAIVAARWADLSPTKVSGEPFFSSRGRPPPTARTRSIGTVSSRSSSPMPRWIVSGTHSRDPRDERPARRVRCEMPAAQRHDGHSYVFTAENGVWTPLIM